MIDALVSAKLHGQPQERTSKAGRAFTTAKVRAALGGNEQGVFINVIAFDDAAQSALLALGDCCAVALSGSLTPKARATPTRVGMKPSCAGSCAK